MGKNDVFLPPSDSDSENDDDTSIMIRPLPTSPKIRQDNVRTWVATSPFSSPRLSPKKFEEERDLNDESRSGQFPSRKGLDSFGIFYLVVATPLNLQAIQGPLMKSVESWNSPPAQATNNQRKIF